jgi:hypothetical protein
MRAEYRYVDPTYPARRVTFDVSRGKYLVADVSQDMGVCAPNGAMQCIRAPGFAFHVPRDFDGKRKSWAADGNRYAVEATEVHEIWGQRQRLRRIRGESTGGAVLYLYSMDSGLMGFTLIGKDNRPVAVYLLAGRCGFGADPKCRN